MSVPLTLLVFISVPFIAIHTLWAAKKKRIYRAKELFYLRKHYSRLHDTLSNIKIVKSLFKEDWALRRVLDAFNKRIKRSLSMILFSRKTGLFNDLFLKINAALFWVLGGYLVIKGKLTFGALSAVSMYVALIVGEMYKLSSVIQAMNAEKRSISRCASFIREVSGETNDKESTAIRDREDGLDEIVFQDLSFTYPTGKRVFGGVNFSVRRGEWTLIRGPSGEGKTTLLSLFLRLFPCDTGTIRLGGTKISEMSRNYLSRNISAVHQEPYLFDESIMDNITLGEEVTPDALSGILALTKIDKLAEGLPLGYNTRIGEAAYSLSGGQKQRIAIARALARNPRILILDEATSFLDEPSEKELLTGIKNDFPDLTVIFVTHRSSALEFADNVFILTGGNIKKETAEHKL